MKRAILIKAFAFLIFLSAPLYAADDAEFQKARQLDQKRASDMLDPIMDMAQLVALKLQEDQTKVEEVDTALYAKVQNILQKDPENFVAWGFLSNLKKMDGKDGTSERQRALAIVDQNIKAHPDWAFQYGSRGNLYENIFHDYVNAKMAYQKALSMTSDDKQKSFYQQKIDGIARKSNQH